MGKLVCENCGSDQVQSTMWVYVNTSKIVDGYGDENNEYDNWCDNCEEHYLIITERQYQDLEKERKLNKNN